MALINKLSAIASSYCDVVTLSKGLSHNTTLMVALMAAVVCVMVAVDVRILAAHSRARSFGMKRLTVSFRGTGNPVPARERAIWQNSDHHHDASLPQALAPQ